MRIFSWNFHIKNLKWELKQYITLYIPPTDGNDKMSTVVGGGGAPTPMHPTCLHPVQSFGKSLSLAIKSILLKGTASIKMCEISCGMLTKVCRVCINYLKLLYFLNYPLMVWSHIFTGCSQGEKVTFGNTLWTFNILVLSVDYTESQSINRERICLTV